MMGLTLESIILLSLAKSLAVLVSRLYAFMSSWMLPIYLFCHLPSLRVLSTWQCMDPDGNLSFILVDEKYNAL